MLLSNRSEPKSYGHEQRHKLLTKTRDIEGKLRRIAQSVVKCPYLADDIVQDTYTKLLTVKIDEEIATPSAFITRIVRNMAIDKVRQMTFERSLFSGSDQTEFCPAGAANCPEARLSGCQALRIIEQTLQELPPHVRNAFYRHRVDGYAQNAIAKDIGVSKASICAYIHQADQRCRQALQNAELANLA